MLKLKAITKTYKMGDNTINALREIDLSLRDNEFVAVLGQSGSGKTTLLNIIGGLDRYDSGEMSIGDVSTKKYSDRDWDSYRNHSVGFVFQSYNLITHQSVLSNVEIALTISGVSKSERRRRAKKALEEVGLSDQMGKRPNQLSGGQMQRVAIARALVNDPEILLADEPTGALDSETSEQVMELLKNVARDRLVVMVTHNSELADKYATRVVRLHDGQIVSDSMPYSTEESASPPVHRNLGKASMSFFTSLSLSFNNLRTKKGRTIITAFAGSIGIIGIALIISLSSGVNKYISDMQKETMVSYPLTIDAQAYDLTGLMGSGGGFGSNNAVTHGLDAVYSNNRALTRANTYSSAIKANNLVDFKKYLDNEGSPVRQYLGENGVIYSYDVKFSTYAIDPEGVIINTDGSDFTKSAAGSAGMGMGGSGLSMGLGSITGGSSSGNHFSEILKGTGGSVVSGSIKSNYDLLSGKWPESYNEVIFAINENNEIGINTLYELGLLPAADYQSNLDKISRGEQVDVTQFKWDYSEILGHEFIAVPYCDYYVLDEDGYYASILSDKKAVNEIVLEGTKLHVVGIVRAQAEASFTPLETGICYTSLLTDYIIERANSSAVVLAQMKSPEKNIINSPVFSYKTNLAAFGYVDYNSPSSISLYADSFVDKEAIVQCIEDYNAAAAEEDYITYTDLVGLMMSSVTSIVDVISYVLIAFVAVSLVVSSIMIGIITFISVLERTKEIGILRAIGASKRNVSQVFNAETFIVGAIAGIIGIAISLLLLIPGNAVIHALTSSSVNAVLPVSSAAILIILSMCLTLIAGLIPSRAAAKKDPVVALRTE